MNKFKILIKISESLWVVAIILMSVNWIRLWDTAFKNTNYIIEDKFIYIGILGGWIFVWILYLFLIIFVGYLILKVIEIISSSVSEAKK